MDEFKSPEAGGGQPAQATKLDLEVKVYPTQKESNILATASITLGGCFTVKGVKIVDGKNGLFVAMPTRRDGQGNFQDICHPTTKEMREALNSAVLGEYQRTMEQSFSRAEKAMEKRGSVLDTLSQKAAEARPPTPGKAKAADKGER